jgi:hypothetical protein
MTKADAARLGGGTEKCRIEGKIGIFHSNLEAQKAKSTCRVCW